MAINRGQISPTYDPFLAYSIKHLVEQWQAYSFTSLLISDVST